MTATFNLVEEPWIKVIDLDGAEREVSIQDLFANASTLQRLADPLETANFAVLRVLLAIMYRAWDSADWQDEDNALDHWEEKWNQDSILDEEVSAYLVAWRPYFDLRSQETPFFQVPDLHTAKNEWKSLRVLLPDTAEAGALFTMRTEMASISAAEAARMVIHAAAYDFSGIKSGAVGDPRVKGGKGYPMGIGWAGWLGGTTILGDNLRETLLLNYVPFRPTAGSNDLPQWECAPLPAGPQESDLVVAGHPEQTGTTGQIELLTWPQRRLRLHWQGERVDGVLVCNGDPVGYTTKHGTETMTPWRFSDPQTKKAKALVYMPRALDNGRALWRSLDGILPNEAAAKVKSKYADGALQFEPAETVKWVGELVDEGVLPKDKVLRLHVVSMEYGAQSSSFADIVSDSLSLSSPLLGVEGAMLRSVARQAVSRTDAISKIVSDFQRDVVFATSGDSTIPTDEAKARVFSEVDIPFRSWLRNLTDAPEPDAALKSWSGFLRNLAERLAREILDSQGPAVWTGRWNSTTNRRVTAAGALSKLNWRLDDLLLSVDEKLAKPNTEKKVKEEAAHADA